MTKTDKYYELTNHLGNVMAVLSDAKHYDDNAQHFTTLTTQAQDYLPFGMGMPGRKYTNTSLADKYRYGFNGKELDNETSTYDYGFRIYNFAIAKFLSVDPLSKKYPMLTSYQFASNMPIWAVDLDGLEAMTMTTYEWTNSDGSLTRNYTTPIETNPVERNAKYGDKGLLNIVFNLDVSPTIPSDEIYTNEVVVTPTKIEKLQRSMALKKQEMRYQLYHKSEDMVKNMNEWSRGLSSEDKLNGISNIGDGIAAFGYFSAPFTQGASLSVAAVGEVISKVASLIEYSARIKREGLTNEIKTDLTIDAAFELAPKPLELLIDKSNLDVPAKKILKAQVNKVNLVIEYSVKESKDKK